MLRCAGCRSGSRPTGGPVVAAGWTFAVVPRQICNLCFAILPLPSPGDRRLSDADQYALPESRARLLHYLALAVLVALGLRLVVLAITGADNHTPGFVSYYTASRLLLEGEPMARFYDTTWFIEQV